MVSPSAWSKEFNATKIIKIIDPANITFVYLRLNTITSSTEPIRANKLGEKTRPIIVINIETKTAYIMVCAKYPRIFSLLFSPMLFATKDVPPTVTPTQARKLNKAHIYQKEY